MKTHKAVVETFMEGFRRLDHAAILECLTDDIVWDVPFNAHCVGKAAFDKEIENEAFVGSPTITVSRLVEENNVVIAEGTVRCTKRDGTPFGGVFCDVFEFTDDQICKLTSYLAMKPE